MAGLAQLPLPFAPVRRRGPGVIAAASNAEARAWLARCADWPQGRLALWGPAAAGKSALLAEWAAREGGRVVQGETLRFPPPAGPLAIDDADRAAPRALLHVLNAAREAGQAVLLAARAPPARWAVALPDLASRLRATTAVAIGPPEDDLLRALLARQLAERQLRVAAPTLDWLVARLPRTHAAAAEAVARLDQAAQALAAPIGPALARHVLPDLLADLPDCELPAPDHDDFASHAPSASPGQGGLL
jgi:chromosomal replication initiation ATPase DnaA